MVHLVMSWRTEPTSALHCIIQATPMQRVTAQGTARHSGLGTNTHMPSAHLTIVLHFGWCRLLSIRSTSLSNTYTEDETGAPLSLSLSIASLSLYMVYFLYLTKFHPKNAQGDSLDVAQLHPSLITSSGIIHGCIRPIPFYPSPAYTKPALIHYPPIIPRGL